MEITIGTFNLLASGLAEGEFLTLGGDKINLNWDLRKEKLADVLTAMIKECDIIVTQENDSFFSLLKQIRQKSGKNINGICCFKANFGKLSTNRSLRTINLLNQQGENIKLIPKDPDHGDHYKLLKHKYRYMDEWPENGDELANLWNHQKEDPYISDDAIGIYYDIDKVKLEHVNDCHTTISNIPILFNEEGWVNCSFSKKGINFNLIGTHLPSGEGQEDEIKRLVILDKILTKDHPISFVVMDSNYSVHYEKEYNLNKTCGQLIQEKGFKDAVPLKGYECLKMRNNMGNQIKKHGALMFDTIDKILYKGIKLIERPYQRNEFNFLKWDLSLYDELLELRTNKEKRKLIQNQVKEGIKTDDLNILIPNFYNLYPNKDAPSDHPPIVCSFYLE